jgi:hypothetical protein
MHTDYTYSENSRRPVTFVAFALSVAMGMFGVTYFAPWYFLAPVALAATMSGVMIVNNRKSGMELTGSALRLYAGNWVEHVAVSDIMVMDVTRWSDGAPSAALSLTSGKKIPIPGYCVGSVKSLEDALAARGIKTRWNP